MHFVRGEGLKGLSAFIALCQQGGTGGTLGSYCTMSEGRDSQQLFRCVGREGLEELFAVIALGRKIGTGRNDSSYCTLLKGRVIRNVLHSFEEQIC